MEKFRLHISERDGSFHDYDFYAKNLSGAKIKSSSIIRRFCSSDLNFFCRLYDALGNKLSAFCLFTCSWVDV